MSKKVKYDGYDKTFYIPKKKVRLKKEARLFINTLLFIVFLSLGLILLNNSYDFGNSTKIISYAESGDTSYKVYLKENNDFDQPFLEEGMGYIASIINSINIDFDYQINVEEDMNFDYEYDVLATLYIMEASSGSILKKEETVLLEKQELEITDNHFIIDIEQDIDYDYYNNYVNQFKAEYSVSIDSKLVVTMNVKAKGTNETVLTEINKDTNLSLEIPLSEQTIEIKFASNKINNSEFLSDLQPAGINDLPLFIISCILNVIALGYLIAAIRVLYAMINNKDIYTKTIKKYLREYDRVIVTSSQPDLNESSFDNKIRVMSIEELIDAHDATGSPIIYYEVIPNEKSYFIIIQGKTLYKLTISRAYLEQEKNA